MAKSEKPAAPVARATAPATAEQLPTQPAASTTAVQEPAPGGEALTSGPGTGEQLLEQPSTSATAASPVLTELDEAIPALWIRSVPPTFRRCGFAFSREGAGIALDALDESQVEQLLAEPNLVVEHTWFTDKVQE